jgi:dihydrodipicolinate synthase/N-acetylneuraminate lyase
LGLSHVSSRLLPLHNSDLFLGQSIQTADQRVDLLVGGLDLALVELLVGGDGGVMGCTANSS